MLLPDLTKEIEQKLAINASSTRSQINLRPNSTRSRILCIQPTFGLCNASSIYQKMIKSIYSA